MSLQTEREAALAQKAIAKEQASAELQVKTFRHNYEHIKTLNSEGKTSGLMEYLRCKDGGELDDELLRADLVKAFPELTITDSWGAYHGMPFSMAGPLVKLDWA